MYTFVLLIYNNLLAVIHGWITEKGTDDTAKDSSFYIIYNAFYPHHNTLFYNIL